MNQELEHEFSESIDRTTQHINEIIHEKVVKPTSEKLAKELLQQQFKPTLEKMILEKLAQDETDNDFDIEFDTDDLD